MDEALGAAGLWATQHHPSFRGNESPPTHFQSHASRLPPPLLITNDEEFVCSICEMFIIEEQGVTLRECRHNFCRPCLTDAIERCSAMIVPCPMTVVKCNKKILIDEAKAMLPETSLLGFLQRPLEMKTRISDIMPRLLDLEENHDYVGNLTEFVCSICTETVKAGEGVVLKNCLHEYCNGCLAQHVETTEELAVQCPYVAEDGTRCEGFLQDREIRLLITEEVLNARNDRSVSQAEAGIPNSFHCKTPDCIGWAEIDAGVANFLCPVCTKTTCIACKAVHEGRSCQDYFYEVNSDARKARDDGLTDAQLNGMIAARQAMPCPRCKIAIEKTVGCNRMTCSSCRHQFQWLGQA